MSLIWQLRMVRGLSATSPIVYTFSNESADTDTIRDVCEEWQREDTAAECGASVWQCLNVLESNDQRALGIACHQQFQIQ